MLSLCGQIIWEWEKSQGREKPTPSKAIDDNVAQVLKSAIENCGIFPGDGENVSTLDRIIELLRYESCYENE